MPEKHDDYKWFEALPVWEKEKFGAAVSRVHRALQARGNRVTHRDARTESDFLTRERRELEVRILNPEPHKSCYKMALPYTGNHKRTIIFDPLLRAFRRVGVRRKKSHGSIAGWFALGI